MNEEPVENRLPGKEPVEKDVDQITEQNTSSEAEPQASDVHNTDQPSIDPTQDTACTDPAEETPAEGKEEDGKAGGGAEPPVDWFEPLEEDDDADSRNDPEEGSLAGESERSESVGGTEKTGKRIYQLHVPRRKRAHPDEGWMEWPAIGEGWKRKEVIRRSGSSIGQKDVYYLSPRGDRVRSKVELSTVLNIDLSKFEYKTGTFHDGEVAPPRVRRMKRKVQERSSSESSFMERGEGADTPDSPHRLTPSLGSKSVQSNHTSLSSSTTFGITKRSEDPPGEHKIRLPPPSSSKPLPFPSINGEIGKEDSTLICARCGVSFTGTWYDKQRKRPFCPSCWASSKTREHPMIRFRKWIPCGQCVGCHNTINCGQCANCKHGLQSPDSRKRLCRKRRCICPIRKDCGSASFMPQKSYSDIPDTLDDSVSYQSEVTDSQQPSLKSSDTENLSVSIDVDDDDDLSTDDDDDWHKKRKRRSCGKCQACLCRKDCGACDFCIDKPKFGGSNKKRQKCRLRQCQRQAMRHLLPFQTGQPDSGPDGSGLPGRPRPQYTYSRKSSLKKNRGSQFGLDVSDNEDDDSNLQPMNWGSFDGNGRDESMQQLNDSDIGVRNGLSDRVPHISNHNSSDHQSGWDAERSHAQKYVEEDEEDEFPMITQIFSLADNSAGGGMDMDNQLIKLLHSLRSSVLPILWYAIMVEGPQLQLIQCSKQSNMTDTMVLIDPGFCYQVTVQKQPLLPTHSLYDSYPARLTSVTEVVNLLLGLEKYVVCQGLPPQKPLPDEDPIILERASTCDFLVKKNVIICMHCRALRGLLS